jgi:hypothetical protein
VLLPGELAKIVTVLLMTHRSGSIESNPLGEAHELGKKTAWSMSLLERQQTRTMSDGKAYRTSVLEESLNKSKFNSLKNMFVVSLSRLKHCCGMGN